MRQHVNPLSRYYQLPRPLPSLEELFPDPTLPLHLDIGSARGRFLLALAPLRPERNHLGLEIRQPLVEAAEADRQAAALPNLRFLFANANVSLPGWLALLPPGRLALVSLQFPDPWFKTRHHKRRVLGPALLHALAGAMAPGSQLFLQSDVLALIEPMVALV
ncbi:MAG: tRNA (guanosine(46)-N7)-methyltransferase TrmB, partial [Cyanobacteriota bacterium]